MLPQERAELLTLTFLPQMSPPESRSWFRGHGAVPDAGDVVGTDLRESLPTHEPHCLNERASIKVSSCESPTIIFLVI